MYLNLLIKVLCLLFALNRWFSVVILICSLVVDVIRVCYFGFGGLLILCWVELLTLQTY